MTLDKSRPFGKITPAYEVPGTDRSAHYEQDGRLFDSHGLPCDAPMAPPAPAVADVRVAATAEASMTVSELLAAADTMHHARLARLARDILGDACPTGKSAIVAALTKLAPQPPPASVAVPHAATPAPVAQVVVAAPAAGTGIDLAAWARGQKDYLFGEVQKAIRITYHKQVTERRDAVDFLIENKVIHAKEARTDVV